MVLLAICGYGSYFPRYQSLEPWTYRTVFEPLHIDEAKAIVRHYEKNRSAEDKLLLQRGYC